jgi:signal peptidase I
MAPTLRQGDYVLVRAGEELGRAPQRGDIVVVAMAEGRHVKRIVGLPGERVAFTQGVLLIDGDRLIEPYLRGLPPYLGLEDSECSLALDEYFIMGDNRSHSTDSRHCGPVIRSSIEGRTICRVWPPRRAQREVSNAGPLSKRAHRG